MNVISSLLLFFVILSVVIFKKRAVFFITGIFLNVVVFLLYLGTIHFGFSVYPMTVLCFLGISCVILFYMNGVSPKTKAAFFSVIGFLLLFTLLVYPLIHFARVQGFSPEELEEMVNFDFGVAVPFSQLMTAVTLLSFSGAVVDGSMAIASATFELFQHTKKHTVRSLISGSMRIVTEALNSTIYTLLFAFLGSSLTLVIFWQDVEYSFFEWINSKLFVGEFLVSMLTGIAAILILPFTAFATSFFFMRKTDLLPKAEKITILKENNKK